VEQLGSGMRWAEGPVYFPGARPGEPGHLLVSDIPNDRSMKYNERTGAFTVFREPSNHANGNTRDREGRLVTCEHGTRRVTRTEQDGRITVLADRYQGKRLNSPNDVVVKTDGTIWFTDPSFGVMSDYVGNKAEQPQPVCGVYRIDPTSAEVELMVDDFEMPNGLAFSPDERRLYVAESAFLIAPTGGRHIRAFDVGDDGRLDGGEVLAEIEPGIPDDAEAYLALPRAPDEPRFQIVTRADGRLIGKILIPEATANLTFGGPRLAPEAWGRGYATEAGQAVLAIARDTMRLKRLRARHHAENPASGRVLRKLGFVETGRSRTFSLARGGEVPSVEMSLELDGADADAQPAMAA